MKATRLKTEYLDAPIGIDINAPRLFWNCSGGAVQTAYQITAAKVCKNGSEIIWDSGKVSSAKMAAIPWDGPPLKSRERIVWKVRLWDEYDIPGDWSCSEFEMGLLSPSDWKAKWITGNYNPKKKKHYPADCFRKSFTCNKTENARFYISACGLYEAHINGKRVGNHIMAPGFTDYNKRIQYQTYDVSSLLLDGKNEITVCLADGWYRGSVGAMGIRNVYGIQTKFIAQLETDTDTIISDESWQWCNNGPVIFADMQDGEQVDLTKTPDYSQSVRTTSYQGILCASNNVPVTEHERFTPVIYKTLSGQTLLDFGQNIAGYVELKLKAHAGQTVFMQFAEHLDTEGELDIASIQCRAGTDRATPKQELSLITQTGDNYYKNKFAVYGFRYAVIKTDIEITPESITAIAVYSDMEQTAVFDCSHDLINRFVKNTHWSMKGNFLDVPTDCPTRERAPWTGDVQIFCKTGTYFMDTAAFFRKWLQDLRDSQTTAGKVPCHAPDVRNNEYFGGIDFIKRMDGCCGWADSAVLVPWHLYQMYNDLNFLKECYPSMKAHILFQISRTNKTGLMGKSFPKPDKKYISNQGQAFGEWLEPADVYQQNVIQDFIAPHPEEATAYLSYVCGIMAEVAWKLGFDSDVPLYEEYHEGCKKAYSNQFTPIDANRQSKLVRPLAFQLLDEKQAAAAKASLIANIEKRNYRIGTGFLSTPLILPLLTELERTDIAYKMLENEAEPGWLYEVKQDATTVWENWDGTASQNHYSPGSVCEWIFETVCGVRLTGEKNFTITPHPGGSLTHASFTWLSVYGEVSSKWHINQEQIEYTIILPANTTAQIILPDDKTYTVNAGTHFLTAAVK